MGPTIVAHAEGLVLAVTRHTVPPTDAPTFLDQVRAALAALARQAGYRSGRVTRATDDPELWLLVTEWDGIGAYRRALSAYDVRIEAVPVLATAHDEPTVFEVIHADGTDGPSSEGSTDLAADAGQVRIGEAAAPDVPTDLG